MGEVTWESPITDLHSGYEDYTNKTKWDRSSETIATGGAWVLVDTAGFLDYKPKPLEPPSRGSRMAVRLSPVLPPVLAPPPPPPAMENALETSPSASLGDVLSTRNAVDAASGAGATHAPSELRLEI